MTRGPDSRSPSWRLLGRRLSVWGMLLVVVLAGCSPGAREAAPFQGNWRSAAWGTYLSINDGAVEIFEYSSVHCFSVASGAARGIADVLASEGEALVLTDAGRTVRFDQIDFLPQQCVAPVVDDAAATFEVLVATVEEHYLPGVDDGWSKRSEALRPGGDASDEVLFEAVTSLLEPLGRPDLRLATGSGTWAATQPDPVAFPEAESLGRGGILAGSLDGGSAYLAFLRLGGFADDVDASQRAAANAIDAAVASAESLVLDLRATDGGSIDHAMLIASRIVPTELVVAMLSARGPAGFAAAGDVTVRPLPTGTYQGAVVVLVGPGTVGVAELLAAALRGVDGVTIIGQPTAGSAAPVMVRFLPNGWSVGLPNLRVTTPAGADLAAGVMPDVFSQDALTEALKILGGW